MKTIIITLICFLCTVYCSANSKITQNKKIASNKPKIEKIDIKTDKMVEHFLKTMQSFEAFNLKQKYELGRTVAQIIHSMRLESGGGAKVKKAKISSMEQADVEADVIDRNPEESWRIAETYIQAYKAKPEKTGDVQWGWKVIKIKLRDEPVYVRSKVLIRAIAIESASLVKRLVIKNYSVANIEKYNYAVRKCKESGTVKSEEIVDFLERDNPDLGAAVDNSNRLQSGWDQVKVHEYIYENNYPMLRRALDAGFDHDFVYEKSGSLLGISVVARCYRCVKMLVERGADVNAPILIDEGMTLKGWDQMAYIKGWTPLMFAVADGNVRIITELFESGSALVSKTGNGQEGPRFHARAVARRIKDEDVRKDILNSLYLNAQELENLKTKIMGHELIKAITSENMPLIDDFLLLNANSKFLPSRIDLERKFYNEPISDLLSSEFITIKYI